MSSMEQPSLFNVRLTDPDTAHTAAALRRVTLGQRVQAELARNPAGLTDWELTGRLGLPDRKKPTVGKRRQEAGAVDTGLRRRSPDGLECIVWTLR